MGLLEKIILPPSESILVLLKELIAFTMMFYLPFAAMVLGSLALSLYYRMRYKAVSPVLARLTGTSFASVLLFGLLPFITLIFLFGQYFYSAPVKASSYLEVLFLIVAAGYILFHFYKQSGDVKLGTASLLVLFVGNFLFLRIFDFLMHPEVWRFTESFFPHVFSMQTLLHLVIFLIFALFLTGILALFKLYSYEESKLEEHSAEAQFLLPRVWGWILVPAIKLPFFLLWDAYLLEIWKFNAYSLYFSGLAIFLIMLVVFSVVSGIKANAVRRPFFIFIIGLLAFVSYVLKLNLDHFRATEEYFTMMALKVHEEKAAIMSEREALYAQLMQPDLEIGQQIFTNKCSSCHAFDRKVFGPPYNEVLAKYEGNVDALRKFISNPVKVDPAYPPMPAQGLTTREVLSIAAYLLQEYEKNANKGE